MNDYDALLIHRSQVAEAERHHARIRLLRDIETRVHNQPDDKKEHTVPLTRLFGRLKTTLESLRWQEEQDTALLGKVCE